MATVGILGGGQLGLMLAQSLDALGHRSIIFEAKKDAPCVVKGRDVVVSSYECPVKLLNFFSAVDVATFETENIPVQPLLPHKNKLLPSLEVLQLAQDRVQEKTFFKQHGFRHVQFRVVTHKDNLRALLKEFGFPCILKSALGGYDGKRQYFLETFKQTTEFPEKTQENWIIEEVVRITAEISCIVARSRTECFTFPVFQNIHNNNILDFTIIPANISKNIQNKAKAIALRMANMLNVIGLLTVEFFIAIGRDGVERLYVNELAPRVHNSGHVTRKACTSSQFDILGKILLNMKISQPRLQAGAWCMGQLLGNLWLATNHRVDFGVRQHFPDVVEVYEYGKKTALLNRKMGHFTVHGKHVEATLRRAHSFRAALHRTAP